MSVNNETQGNDINHANLARFSPICLKSRAGNQPVLSLTAKGHPEYQGSVERIANESASTGTASRMSRLICLFLAGHKKSRGDGSQARPIAEREAIGWNLGVGQFHLHMSTFSIFEPRRKGKEEATIVAS